MEIPVLICQSHFVTIPGFHLYFRTIVSKTPLCWHQTISAHQWNGRPEINPTAMAIWSLTRASKLALDGETQGRWKAGYLCAKRKLDRYSSLILDKSLLQKDQRPSYKGLDVYYAKGKHRPSTPISRRGRGLSEKQSNNTNYGPMPLKGTQNGPDAEAHR